MSENKAGTDWSYRRVSARLPTGGQ